MKTSVVLLVFLSATAFGQDSLRTVTTVFYFGGTDCPFSTDSTNIANINRMRAELPEAKQATSFKFVLVVMDRDIEQGIEFSKKYPHWDEISVGQFYDNELMLQHVNRAKIPGVPHIMVYRDSLKLGKYGIPTIEKRQLLVDLAGESAIGKWIKDGFPFDKGN